MGAGCECRCVRMLLTHCLLVSWAGIVLDMFYSQARANGYQDPVEAAQQIKIQGKGMRKQKHTASHL